MVTKLKDKEPIDKVQAARLVAARMMSVTGKWGSINNLRSTVHLAVNNCEPQLAESFATIVSNPMAKEIISPEYWDHLTDNLDDISRKIATTTKSRTKLGVDAACIVLAHAMFEDALNTCIEIAVWQDLDDIKCRLGDQHVKLKDLLKLGVDGVLHEAVHKHIKETCRAPLLKKFRYIDQASKGTVKKVNAEHGVTIEKLREVDEVRHQIAHHAIPLNRISDDGIEIQLLYDASILSLVSICRYFGLVMDSTSINEIGDQYFTDALYSQKP